MEREIPREERLRTEQQRLYREAREAERRQVQAHPNRRLRGNYATAKLQQSQQPRQQLQEAPQRPQTQPPTQQVGKGVRAVHFSSDVCLCAVCDGVCALCTAWKLSLHSRAMFRMTLCSKSLRVGSTANAATLVAWRGATLTTSPHRMRTLRASQHGRPMSSAPGRASSLGERTSGSKQMGSGTSPSRPRLSARSQGEESGGDRSSSSSGRRRRRKSCQWVRGKGLVVVRSLFAYRAAVVNPMTGNVDVFLREIEKTGKSGYASEYRAFTEEERANGTRKRALNSIAAAQ